MPSFTMPTVDVESIQDHGAHIYAQLIARGGRLRASKPKIDGLDPESGRAAYIWRMVAFLTSPNPRHQCMPVCADFDLQGIDWTERRQITKHLDGFVDIIVNAIPKDQWHGVRRWGQAFGQIGTPQINAEGAVIYR